MDPRFVSLMEALGLPVSASLDALRDIVRKAVQRVSCSCDPMAAECVCAGGRPGCACDDCYCWIQDLFPDQVVYSQNGQLLKRTYAVSAGAVTLGAPSQVEMAYVPIGESHREMVREAEQFEVSEAAKVYDKTKGELTITVIKPGLNKNGTYIYPAEVLKRDHQVFDNQKMFANHATEAENKTRPEGDTNQWVAQTGKTWAESDGTVKAKAVIVCPVFKAKMDRLHEAGLLNEQGVSIRAAGEARLAESNGNKVKVVERFIAARSVDFVTYPGAGGRVEVMESDRSDEFDVDVVTEAQLRERRPDLVELFESHARKEMETMKTLEQQLQEAQTQIKALEADKTRLQEAVTTAAKNTSAATLSTLLTEAKLPKAADEKLRKQFDAAITTDGMQEAIDAEKAYIAAITPTPATATTTVTKRNGTADNGTQEADATAPTFNLVESFQKLGMTEAQAKIAAAGK